MTNKKLKIYLDWENQKTFPTFFSNSLILGQYDFKYINSEKNNEDDLYFALLENNFFRKAKKAFLEERVLCYILKLTQEPELVSNSDLGLNLNCDDNDKNQKQSKKKLKYITQTLFEPSKYSKMSKDVIDCDKKILCLNDDIFYKRENNYDFFRTLKNMYEY